MKKDERAKDLKESPSVKIDKKEAEFPASQFSKDQRKDADRAAKANAADRQTKE